MLSGLVASHIVETFDWIDSVVEGPGEEIIADFAQAATLGPEGKLPPELVGALGSGQFDTEFARTGLQRL